jgi:uncharacterized iron-regulated membrane protein
MRETFRQAMLYLHTWLGLVLGFVLMVVFFFGSTSVFDREIDRWTVPETRAQAQPLPSFDRVLLPLFDHVRPDPESMEHEADHVEGPLPPAETLKAAEWWVGMGHRDTLIDAWVTYDLPNKPKDPAADHAHVHGHVSLNPQTGEKVPDNLAERLRVGSGFFYPMHFGLHLEWLDLGIWIVGLAGLAMLAALVSGVIIHRRLFVEFFTFRPEKVKLRSTLDLHNVTGVLALPFLLVITFSGLLIFAGFYLPSTSKLMLPLVKAQEKVEATVSGLPKDPAGRPGSLGSVDAMMVAAKARWAERGVPGEVGSVAVTHVGDENAYVSIWRDNVDRVATNETLHFDADTGKLLYEDPPARPVQVVSGFLYGLHFQHFQHWGLRWLLFAGGLMGCVCIATGFLFFVERRKRKHAEAGVTGARIVDALAVTAVTGMVIATLCMLIGNRVLPINLPDHDVWQKGVFWLSWLAAMVHAFLRSGPVGRGGVSMAWAEQTGAVAALAIAAVLANWVTTGDHLVKTLSQRYWPVAGMDLVLLTAACIALLAARALGRRKRDSAAREPALSDLEQEPAQ